MKIIIKDTPSQSARIHGNDAVRLVVAHTPEGTYQGTIGHVMNKANEVSYHRFYKQDGSEAVQFVVWERKAWHAGSFNSLSDGISIEGFARHFDLEEWDGIDEYADGIAERLVARNLPCQWTTDPIKGGFCRHGDLQRDRTDPTPDLTEWKLFCGLVAEKYKARKQGDDERVIIGPNRRWFWGWMQWKDAVGPFKKVNGKRPPRPNTWNGQKIPRIIPSWAWQARRNILKRRRI